jgi:hypothetical protein
MPKVVNLALQGGGSHGAFTWGVLDRLLEEERLSFEGISATSAGAVNAVVLADGLAAGGREGAREALRVTCREPNRKVVDALFFRPAVRLPRTTKARQWASNRGDDEEWIDHLGDRAWINWAPGVLPRSCKDRHDQGCDVDARRVEAQRGGVTRPARAGVGPFFEGSGGWSWEWARFAPAIRAAAKNFVRASK